MVNKKKFLLYLQLQEKNLLHFYNNGHKEFKAEIVFYEGLIKSIIDGSIYNNEYFKEVDFVED